MMKVKAGEFKHPIVIQRCEQTINKDNIPVKVWSELLSARARITNLSGKEYTAMNGEVSSITTKFTIRAPRELLVTTNDRIVYKSNYYNIKHCNNIMELGMLLEIVAEVVI